MSLDFFFLFNAQHTHTAIILLLSFYKDDLYDTLKSTFCVICVSRRKDGSVFIFRIKNVGNDMIGLLPHTAKGDNVKDRINTNVITTIKWKIPIYPQKCYQNMSVKLS